jgi:hypothetical protein
LLEDLRRIDQQRRDTRRRLAWLVAASKTGRTDLYDVGPISAATVLGYVGDIGRFPTGDQVAAYNGTAPIEVSSGNRTIYRLSRRGNRQPNHAIHMAAVTQIRDPSTTGRTQLIANDQPPAKLIGTREGTQRCRSLDKLRELVGRILDADRVVTPPTTQCREDQLKRSLTRHEHLVPGVERTE